MNVLIVGEPSKEFTEYIQASHHEYRLLTTVSAQLSPPIPENKMLRIDFSDETAVIAGAQKLNNELRFDCSITQNEAYIEKIAAINKALNLAGNSIETAIACTDKEIMRGRFLHYDPSITPVYKQVMSLKDCQDFANQYGYPCVIKAAGLAKSLLVVKVNNEGELEDKYNHVRNSIQEVYDVHFPHKQPKIIIEEFMAGSVHSVDAYTDKDGEVYVLEDIVDCVTGYDIGANDNFHYKQQLPSNLSAEDQFAVREVAAKGVKALGMHSSAAHAEIIVTKTGPKIVEIAARHGGKRQSMHMLANGYNLFDSWLACNAGQKVSPKHLKQEHCVLIFLVPRHKGEFASIKNHEELLKLPSLVDFHQVTPFNTVTGKAADGYKPPIELLLHNADKAQFEKDVDFIDKNVEIIVKN